MQIFPDYSMPDLMLVIMVSAVFVCGAFHGQGLSAALRGLAPRFWSADTGNSKFMFPFIWLPLFVMAKGALSYYRGVTFDEMDMSHGFMVAFTAGAIAGLISKYPVIFRWIFLALQGAIASVAIVWITEAAVAIGARSIPGYIVLLCWVITGLVLILNSILTMMKLPRARRDVLVTSVPDGPDSENLRRLVEALARDCQMLEKPIDYSPLRLYPTMLPDYGFECGTLIASEAMFGPVSVFLRISVGLKDGNTGISIPAVSEPAVWFRVPAAQVTDVSLKDDDSAESEFTLRNSGLRVIVKGAKEPFITHARLNTLLASQGVRPSSWS